jgi:5-aminolevulinate synthase
VTVWCSNDYLGMGQHPKVIEAMIGRVDRMRHRRRRHAQHLGQQPPPQAAGGRTGRPARQGRRAAVHLGLRVELGGAVDAGSRLPNAVILSDELNHASMIEGIRHARCQKVIWKHNDPEDLDRKLAALPANATKIVAFESVYSMDGDIARSPRSSTSARSTAR